LEEVMKSVTLRGVDPELAEQLKVAAKEQGKSINQLAIDLLKDCVGLTKRKHFLHTYSDLDHLFGRWSDEDFTTITNSIDRLRMVRMGTSMFLCFSDVNVRGVCKL
jgi:HicB family